MHIKSKAAVIGEALDDWRDRGLLDPDTAARLRADLDRGSRRLSFNGFVITAGVICLCFAIITFVAANWEEMSRLTRLLLVILTLWAAWGAALWTGLRQLYWWHQGLMLLACGAFGAGIMLVSQIYHIQGNAADAVWLWALGTLLAAALTRGSMVLVLGIGLFALWHGMQIDTFMRDTDLNLPYLGWWLMGSGLALWLRSRAAAHISVIALCFWLLSALTTVQSPVLAALILAGLAVTAISGLLASLSGPRLLRGFEGVALAYAVLMLGLVTFYLTLSVTETGLRGAPPETADPRGWIIPALMLIPPLVLALIGQVRGWLLAYDLWVSVVAGVLILAVYLVFPLPLLPQALLLALFIWITRMGWRLDLRSLRVIGTGGFVLALLMIYGVTVGTLIGTSGFYLGAGVILLGGAWIATRLDPKRDSGS
jgi:uncharacterized membrane protein